MLKIFLSFWIRFENNDGLRIDSLAGALLFDITALSLDRSERASFFMNTSLIMYLCFFSQSLAYVLHTTFSSVD